LTHEEIDDVAEVAPERRLAAGEPEVCDGRHRARDFFDLREVMSPGLFSSSQ
jgi:hypothetical protein